MNINVKGLVSDFLRVGVGVAAVLAIVLQLAGGLHVPAQDVVYISAIAGALNAVLGILKPYGSAAVKSVLKK